MTQQDALKILKTGANVFLTGEPGSGKTYTVNAFVSHLRDYAIEPAITASTGIAATHIGGMTIHSWAGIGIKSKLDKYELDRIASSEHIAKRIRRARVLIIDEISMLPPETLSMVDAVCREVKQTSEAFGGLQVVFVGDFFQLPPIIKNLSRDQNESDSQEELFLEEVKRFAYDSPAWLAAKPLVLYLTEQHRQDDGDFLSVLSSIRDNTFDETHLKTVGTRKYVMKDIKDNIPKLFSHNADVDSVNLDKLSQINMDEKKFVMAYEGREGPVAALKKGCLSPDELSLKVGAQVMFTKNNVNAGFVNGTLGVVKEFDSLDGKPVVLTRSGRLITVSEMDWTVEEGGKIKARISQIPLRLAWAITVHKSQGMSLDEAVMDLSDVFEYGQGYVALSRVRRLTGLYIIGWNDMTFRVHPEVLEKDTEFRTLSEAACKAFDEIASVELSTMHENFIKASGGRYVQNKRKKTKGLKREMGDSANVTMQYIKDGKSVKAVASERGLVPTTIVSHIEELFESGKLVRDDIRHLASGTLKDLEVLQNELRKDEKMKLKPVFERFDGKYSYEDIRVARLLLE
jgi:hypothetical protein